MNTYIYLHRLRPLISNPILSSIKSHSSPLNLRSSFSSHTVWRSQLCSARKVQLFQCDALIRPYTTSSAPSSIPDYKKHSHAGQWGIERIMSIMSLSALPAVFMIPNENLECLVSLIIALHFHWGLEATLVDYIRPSVFGNVIPKFTELYSAVISGFVFVLLLWCAIYGNGIVRTIQQFWYLDLDINPYIDDDVVA